MTPAAAERATMLAAPGSNLVVVGFGRVGRWQMDLASNGQNRPLRKKKKKSCSRGQI